MPITRTGRAVHVGRAARAAVCIAVGALLLAACSGSQTHSPRATSATAQAPQGPYVALGDSYTSGDGIPDPVGTPAGCRRSDRDYPALVAQRLRLKAAEVRDVSCSGARISDLSAAQSTGDGANPAQLTALSAATALVTVGIGGNDVDFAGVLTRCVTEDLIPALIGGRAAQVAPCRAYYTGGGVDRLGQQIQAAASDLADALAQIARRAPHARVYVVGYPALLPAAGASCGHTLGITPGDVSFLHQQELRLNSMLRQRAEAAGAAFVDTFTPSAGHDACSAAAGRWIEPLLPDSPAAPLHPNARGEQGMAEAVVRAVMHGA